MSEIKVIKFVWGEEILADVVRGKRHSGLLQVDTLLLNKPANFAIQIMENGKANVGMRDMLIAGDSTKKLEVDWDRVAFMYDPNEAIRAQYMTNFHGGGIVPASVIPPQAKGFLRG